MRLVLALCIVAVLAVGVAAQAMAEDTTAVSSPTNAPFVPQAAEVDEVEADDEDQDVAENEVDIDEEDSDSDEADEQDADADEEGDEDQEEDEEADEADEEEEFSFLEAAAATAATTAAAADNNNAAVTQTAAAATTEAEAASDRPRAPRPREFKFHPERVTAQTSKNEDPEMAKLNLALDAVKEDILATNKQITDERKWVIAVAKIIASYNDKMKRVEGHIVALRKEMKSLYRKKKQIENLKLQKALEAKLKEARDELATLTSSLKHVDKKKGELNKSGRDLRETIAGIQAQLAKLRGQQMRSKPKPAVLSKGRKGKGKGRCKKGQKYSKKAKKCVPAKKKGKGKKLNLKKLIRRR